MDVKLSDNIIDIILYESLPNIKNRYTLDVNNAIGSIFYEYNKRGIFIYTKRGDRVVFLTCLILGDHGIRGPIKIYTRRWTPKSQDFLEYDVKNENFLKFKDDTKDSHIIANPVIYSKEEHPLIMNKYKDMITYRSSSLILNNNLASMKFGVLEEKLEHTEKGIPNFFCTCVYGAIVHFFRHHDDFIKSIVNAPIYELDPFVVSLLYICILMGDTIMKDGNNICQKYLEGTEPDVFTDIFNKNGYVRNDFKTEINRITCKYELAHRYYRKTDKNITIRDTNERTMIKISTDKYERRDTHEILKRDYIFNYLLIYIYSRVMSVSHHFNNGDCCYLQFHHIFQIYISCSEFILKFYSQNYKTFNDESLERAKHSGEYSFETEDSNAKRTYPYDKLIYTLTELKKENYYNEEKIGEILPFYIVKIEGKEPDAFIIENSYELIGYVGFISGLMHSIYVKTMLEQIDNVYIIKHVVYDEYRDPNITCVGTLEPQQQIVMSKGVALYIKK